MLLPKPDLRCFFGKSGSGKSVLWRHQAASSRRLLVVDPNGEPDNEPLGEVVRDPKALFGALRRPSFRLVWRGGLPRPVGGGMAPLAAFALACRAAWAAGDCLMVWEEAPRFMTALKAPEEAMRLATAGRHRGVRVYVAAQRPARVPRDVTANATRVCAFRTIEPRDITYLSDLIGRGARAVALLDAARFEVLDWSVNGAVSRRFSPFS